MIEFALAYAEMGWHVIPLHSVIYGPNGPQCSCRKNCTSPAKHPLTPNGLKNATTRPDWIKAWWHKWPHANIGIVTGEISNLIVIDVDNKNGGEFSLEKVEEENGRLPHTLEVITGSGGMHFFFKHPGKPITNKAGTILGKGIDIRGDGGYVVAAPSVHISGNNYEWEASSEPGMIEVASMPEWMVKRLTEQTIQAQYFPEGVIGEGLRNNYLISCAGTMRRKGMGFNAIFAALRWENTERCIPQLEETEVFKIAKSVMRYEPARPEQKTLSKNSSVS